MHKKRAEEIVNGGGDDPKDGKDSPSGVRGGGGRGDGGGGSAGGRADTTAQHKPFPTEVRNVQMIFRSMESKIAQKVVSREVYAEARG